MPTPTSQSKKCQFQQKHLRAKPVSPEEDTTNTQEKYASLSSSASRKASSAQSVDVSSDADNKSPFSDMLKAIDADKAIDAMSSLLIGGIVVASVLMMSISPILSLGLLAVITLTVATSFVPDAPSMDNTIPHGATQKQTTSLEESAVEAQQASTVEELSDLGNTQSIAPTSGSLQQGANPTLFSASHYRKSGLDTTSPQADSSMPTL